MSCTCGLWTVDDVDGHLTIEKTLLTTNHKSPLKWSGQHMAWAMTPSCKVGWLSVKQSFSSIVTYCDIVQQISAGRQVYSLRPIEALRDRQLLCSCWAPWRKGTAWPMLRRKPWMLARRRPAILLESRVQYVYGCLCHRLGWDSLAAFLWRRFNT